MDDFQVICHLVGGKYYWPGMGRWWLNVLTWRIWWLSKSSVDQIIWWPSRRGQMYVWLVVSKNQNIFKWYGDVIKQQHYGVWESSKQGGNWGESVSWFSDDLMNTMALDGKKGNARPEAWKKGVYAQLVHWNRTQSKMEVLGHKTIPYMYECAMFWPYLTIVHLKILGKVGESSRLAD